MPGFIAKKLCPDLTIVPCNFDKYRTVSHKVRKIVAEYDPDYCASSLDEMHLDLTEYIRKKFKKAEHEHCYLKNDICDSLEDDDSNCNYAEDYLNCMKCSESISEEVRDKIAFETVQEIRERICNTTQLTASAGNCYNYVVDLTFLVKLLL